MPPHPGRGRQSHLGFRHLWPLAAASWLIAEGDRHAHQAENAEALSSYIEALDLVPEPRGDHQATTRIFHGLRRVLQARGDLGDGMELLLATRPGVGSMLARLAGRGEWVG